MHDESPHDSSAAATTAAPAAAAILATAGSHFVKLLSRALSFALPTPIPLRPLFLSVSLYLSTHPRASGRLRLRPKEDNTLERSGVSLYGCRCHCYPLPAPPEWPPAGELQFIPFIDSPMVRWHASFRRRWTRFWATL